MTTFFQTRLPQPPPHGDDWTLDPEYIYPNYPAGDWIIPSDKLLELTVTEPVCREFLRKRGITKLCRHHYDSGDRAGWTVSGYIKNDWYSWASFLRLGKVLSPPSQLNRLTTVIFNLSLSLTMVITIVTVKITAFAS